MVGRLKRSAVVLCEYGRNRVVRGKPLILRLCIINRCNADCPFCITFRDQPEETMSFADYCIILDKVAGNIELADFGFAGEPLLNPDLFRMLEYTKSKGVDTMLHTNGRLLDDGNVAALVRSGVDLAVINMNALARDYYVRSPEDLHPGFLAGLNNYLQASAGTGTQVTLQLITKNGKADVDSKALREAFIVADNCVLQIKPEQEHSYETSPAGAGTARCFRLFQELAVSAGGDAVLCCSDSLCRTTFGNLLQDDFEDVWVNRMNAVRGGGISPLCINCRDNADGPRNLLVNALLSPLSAQKLYRKMMFKV
jgi:hypothetical protein